jgi:hypothetical protein
VIDKRDFAVGHFAEDGRAVDRKLWVAVDAAANEAGQLFEGAGSGEHRNWSQLRKLANYAGRLVENRWPNIGSGIVPNGRKLGKINSPVADE